MKHFAVTFVGVMITVLAVPSWSSGGEEQSPVVIDILHPWNKRLPVIEDLMEEWYTVDVHETILHSDLWELIESEWSVFSGFDILGFPPRWGPYLEEGNLLESICDCIVSKHIDLARLHGIAQTPASRWMLPIRIVHYYYLYYNKDLFAVADLEGPPTSHREFLEYAETLTDSGSSVHGLVLPLPSGVTAALFPLIWSSGGALMVDRKPNVEIEPVIDVLRLVKALHSKSSMFDPRMNEKTAEKYFASGRAAMMLGPSEYGDRWRHMYPDLNFGVAFVPTAQGDPRQISRVRAGALGILRNSGRQKEACSVIAHIVSQDVPMDTGDPELPVELDLLFARHVIEMLDEHKTETETASAIQQAWVSELAIYQ